MKTNKVNGKEFKVKYTLRALFIFEQITKKPFEIKTLLDNYVFFYSIILANNDDNILEWNEFIDALDENPKLFTDINDIVNQSAKVEEIIDGEVGADGQKKSLSISELYAILTLKLGIAPDYVLDKMCMYEAKALLKYQYYKDKENWEQTRLLGYITVQVNSTKKIKINDILKFEWDEQNHENKPKLMEDSELQRLKQKAKTIIDNNIL